MSVTARILNPELDVHVTNELFDVQIDNEVLNVNVTNEFIETNSLIYGQRENMAVNPLRLDNNNSLVVTGDVSLINHEDLVCRIKGQDEEANLYDLQIRSDGSILANIMNESINVDITNEELNVNLTNTELDVNIVNEVVDVNIDNAEIAVQQSYRELLQATIGTTGNTAAALVTSQSIVLRGFNVASSAGSKTTLFLYDESNNPSPAATSGSNAKHTLYLISNGTCNMMFPENQGIIFNNGVSVRSVTNWAGGTSNPSDVAITIFYTI